MRTDVPFTGTESHAEPGRPVLRSRTLPFRSSSPQMVIATAAPGGTLVPAAGDCSITVRGSWYRSHSSITTSPRTKWRVSSEVLGPSRFGSTARPVRSGTGTEFVRLVIRAMATTRITRVRTVVARRFGGCQTRWFLPGSGWIPWCSAAPSVVMSPGYRGHEMRPSQAVDTIGALVPFDPMLMEQLKS